MSCLVRALVLVRVHYLLGGWAIFVDPGDVVDGVFAE